MKTKLFITGLVFMTLGTLVSAQNSEASKSPLKDNVKSSAYVDANNNGVCDNYENRTSTATVRLGNRFSKGCPLGQGQGQGKGNGKGQCLVQAGKGKGIGRNGNFVDADKNGICDYFEAASKK